MVYCIRTYETSSGKVPVKEYINDRKKCAINDAKKIKREIMLLSEFGHKQISDSKNIKPIKSVDGLYELSVNNHRLFFSFCEEFLIMFFHSYTKTDSSNKKQDHEIGIAAKRMREYQSLGICE